MRSPSSSHDQLLNLVVEPTGDSSPGRHFDSLPP